MLPTLPGQVSNYLAYVLSAVYTVDQLILNISGGLTDGTAIATFLANLLPAPGASMMVVDSNDVENTGVNLVVGNLLKVTAGDGVTSAYYSIDILATSLDDFSNGPIRLYPNPGTDKINITGLEHGNRIRVYNLLGVLLRDMVAYQSHEVISLEDQPNGIYFVVVSNDDSVIGRYKLIMK